MAPVPKSGFLSCVMPALVANVPKDRYPLDGQAVDLQSHKKQWVQDKRPQWVYFGVYFGYTSRYTSENYIAHSANNVFGRFFCVQTATARAPANGFERDCRQNYK